jgi:predicted dehydrogenase
LFAGAAATQKFWGGSVARAAESPNAKLNVAAIGLGERGSYIGHFAGKLGNMVACCDVNRDRARKFASEYDGSCAIHGDYRKLLEQKGIDAVVIGTPDHWHVAIAIAALESGRDVYCEKPLTLTIDEGKLLCQAVKKTGRVFQVGTQQRSDKKFLTAVALARSGRLGKELTATCCLGKGASSKPFETSKPPGSLDWDFWLGQAPKVDYTKQRCDYMFRNWLEYSGGVLTDWGAHHVDIAQWGLGEEHTGPIEIEGSGQYANHPEDFDPVAFFAGKQIIPNGYNVVSEFKVNLAFVTGARIIVQSEIVPAPGEQHPGSGIWFKGAKGEVYVSRTNLRGSIIDELTNDDQHWLNGEIDKLNKGMRDHMTNFFDCVKTRKTPVSDVWSHHRALSSCHMANLAMLLKRKLRWDPDKEVFVGDSQANALLSRPRRKGYEIGA